MNITQKKIISYKIYNKDLDKELNQSKDLYSNNMDLNMDMDMDLNIESNSIFTDSYNYLINFNWNFTWNFIPKFSNQNLYSVPNMKSSKDFCLEFHSRYFENPYISIKKDTSNSICEIINYKFLVWNELYTNNLLFRFESFITSSNTKYLVICLILIIIPSIMKILDKFFLILSLTFNKLNIFFSSNLKSVLFTLKKLSLKINCITTHYNGNSEVNPRSRYSLISDFNGFDSGWNLIVSGLLGLNLSGGSGKGDDGDDGEDKRRNNGYFVNSDVWSSILERLWLIFLIVHRMMSLYLLNVVSRLYFFEYTRGILLDALLRERHSGLDRLRMFNLNGYNHEYQTPNLFMNEILQHLMEFVIRLRESFSMLYDEIENLREFICSATNSNSFDQLLLDLNEGLEALESDIRYYIRNLYDVIIRYIRNGLRRSLSILAYMERGEDVDGIIDSFHSSFNELWDRYFFIWDIIRNFFDRNS